MSNSPSSGSPNRRRPRHGGISMAPHPTLSPRCCTGNVHGAGRGIQGEGPCFFHRLRKSLHRVRSSVLFLGLPWVSIAAGEQAPTVATTLPAISPVVVPFEIRRGHIMVPARLSGSNFVSLLLDTG